MEENNTYTKVSSRVHSQGLDNDKAETFTNQAQRDASGNYEIEKSQLSGKSFEDEHLGPLPYKWEKAFTENGETYFIDHNTGTSHWLDPRLSKFQKRSLEECSEDELPYGWERINDPTYGTYYIDHVNRKTQYENPVLQAKRIAMNSSSSHKVNHMFTRDPSELIGERISTILVKSTIGLGFTIVGGDDEIPEFLQIKSIVPNGPAWRDGKLFTGDVLVYVNDICVLGFSHHEMVDIFQSILPGEYVTLNVCRGYSLPFDPNDPNTEVITTFAVDSISGQVSSPNVELDRNYNMPELSSKSAHTMDSNVITSPQQKKVDQYGFFTNGDSAEVLYLRIRKGEKGFGFTIADSAQGQKVKTILDHNICTSIIEGDILIQINDQDVKSLSHSDVVQVLKDCPKDQETIIKVQRSTLYSHKLNKFDDRCLNKKMGGSALMSRSKTPTSELYGNRPKMVLPIRPKTPLIDTRTKTSLFNEDDYHLHINSSNGLYNNEIDITDFGRTFPKLMDSNSQRFNSLELLDESCNNYLNRDIYDLNGKFRYPIDEKSTNGYYGASNPHNETGSMYMQFQSPNYNSHYKGCFCLACQDASSAQRSQDCTSSHYSLPPQMSEDVGRKLKEFISGRKWQSSLQESSRPTPASNTLFDGIYSTAFQEIDDHFITEVTLERQANGFGFRIVGGTEEGSQVTIGHIIPDGAACIDGRIATGDEILMINGVSVENSSHHRVVQLMREAKQKGHATLLLRRRLPTSGIQQIYPHEVIVNRSESEGFGFVIISSSSQQRGSSIGKLIPGSPAERSGELKIGDRIIAVNDVDITRLSHGDVVNLIKESGLQVVLTIDNPREYGNYNLSNRNLSPLHSNNGNANSSNFIRQNPVIC